MKLFKASFENTGQEIDDFYFDDIDDLVNAVEEIDDRIYNEQDKTDYYAWDTSDIKIELNVVVTDDFGDVIKFISQFDELNYDLMVEIGDGDYDQFWEDKGTEYYQYQYLVYNLSKSAEEALDEYEEVGVFFGSRSDYAYEFVNDVYNIEGVLANYFDYEQFGKDLERDGDIVEFEDNVWILDANR